jgi:hypothetical protein
MLTPGKDRSTAVSHRMILNRMILKKRDFTEEQKNVIFLGFVHPRKITFFTQLVVPELLACLTCRRGAKKIRNGCHQTQLAP